MNALVESFVKKANGEEEGGKKPSEKVVAEFLKRNPRPSDEKFHAWTEKKDIKTPAAEGKAYGLASKMSEIMKGGKSKGKMPEGVPPEDVKRGTAIEKEHTSDPEVAKKITADHTTEFKGYYNKRFGLPAFEKHLETMKKTGGVLCFEDAFVDELDKMGGVIKDVAKGLWSPDPKKHRFAAHLAHGLKWGVPTAALLLGGGHAAMPAARTAYHLGAGGIPAAYRHVTGAKEEKPPMGAAAAEAETAATKEQHAAAARRHAESETKLKSERERELGEAREKMKSLEQKLGITPPAPAAQAKPPAPAEPVEKLKEALKVKAEAGPKRQPIIPR
jgi:hypothetical protein